MTAGGERVKPRLQAGRVALAAMIALVLAACTSPSSGQGGATTGASTAPSTTPTSTTTPSSTPATGSTTTSTSTTSTTTPPVPVDGGGSSTVRVRVAALPPGAVVPTAISPASPAWLKMVPIAFSRFGSGPDLLLIAGQDGTMSWWDAALLSDLSRRYRVTVFDLPGAGYSGAPTAPLSLGWLADMTAGLAFAVGLSHPVVLGWGLGGEIALALAERHPGLASSLVLVDTSGGGGSATPPASGVARLLALPGATPVALARLLFPRTNAGRRASVPWASSLLATPDFVTARSIAAEAELQARFWKHSPLTPGLLRVEIPALVVSGADDTVFPPQNAPALDGLLPHAKLVMLTAAGYGAIIQDEPAFVAAVEGFTG